VTATTFDHPGLPPGPRGPAAYHTLRFMLQPDAFLEDMRRFGDVFRVRALSLKGAGVMSADVAKEIFAKDPDKAFDVFAGPLRHVFGPKSLFTTAGTTHKKARKLLNPRFHGQRMKSFSQTMQDVARAHFAKLRPGDRVKMSDVGQAISLDVIIETVFGSGGIDRNETRALLAGLLDGFPPIVIFAERLQHPLFPRWRRYLERRERFDAFVRETVAKRRSGEAGEDILGLLVSARYEDGSALDEIEIRDHLFALLMAGHETTAIAIAWATYFLLREDRAREKLLAELDAIDPLTPDALVKAPYLGAFCDETLRAKPIVLDVVRPAAEPMRVGPYEIPKGEAVVIFLAAILSDPRTFPEPEAFKPERFLDKSVPGSAFLPFGGGHRRCLGAAFAEQEMRIVLGTLARELNLELVSRAPEHAKRRNVTMGPSRGVPVIVRGKR
jgi:cytochrome P450